jgi:release factor glutamine methyltransferase
LKHRHPSARLRAVDCSAAALQVARANAARHALQVECLQGDWWQPLAGRRLHLAASNPPYVAEGDPHLPRLRHEPLSALTAGPDGLAALTRIVREAPVYLHDGAWLLLEHGHQQADAVRRLLADAGFDHVQSRVDLAGRLRCSGGRLGWAG